MLRNSLRRWAPVFIAYSSYQVDLAERIRFALEGMKYEVVFEQPGKYDPARETLVPKKILAGLARSRFMVFMISPESVCKGAYALSELEIVKKTWSSPHLRVVPVVAEPTERKDLPTFLESIDHLKISGDATLEVVHAVGGLVDQWCARVQRWVLGVLGVVAAAALVVFVASKRASASCPTCPAEGSASGTDPSSNADVAPVEPRRKRPERPTMLIHLDAHTTTRLVELPPRAGGSIGRFWLGQTEVTEAQWIATMGTNVGSAVTPSDDRPVRGVSWEHAIAFLNQLSRSQQLQPCYVARDGHWHEVAGFEQCEGFRLPTDREWTYAAGVVGGGSGHVGPWPRLWSFDRVSASRPRRGSPRCHTVIDFIGEAGPNDWDLYDMPGNVLEWVSTPARPRGAAPEGQSGIARLARGGWCPPPLGLNAGPERFEARPGSIHDGVGFRIARGSH